ncbi:unnamed protein product [Rhodiola kirilowii]
MDRRSYARGQPRSSYRPPHSSTGTAAAQNPNANNRSSNFDRRARGGDGSGGRCSEIHRSSLVSGNSRREGSDDRRLSDNVVGTCTLMCPERERAQRERLRDLSVFERLNGDRKMSSPSLAVKKFCRTISTNKASDLRPLSVLEDTLKYLLSLVDNSDHPFEVIHDFVFDRVRSIRQDLSIQNLYNDRAIHMYEEMVKFHIISDYKLRRCSPSPHTSSAQFLNMEQLMKALTSLFNLYGANRENKPKYENEAQFCSFYILLHLDSDNKSKGESLALWLRNVPSPIMKSKEVSFSRRMLRAYRMGNYKQFFCTARAEASYMQYCILESCFNKVRAFALACINHCGYKLHPFPLASLSKILLMTVLEVESFCHSCGLETHTDEKGEKFLNTKQAIFACPKDGFMNYSCLGLEHYEKQ